MTGGPKRTACKPPKAVRRAERWAWVLSVVRSAWPWAIGAASVFGVIVLLQAGCESCDRTAREAAAEHEADCAAQCDVLGARPLRARCVPYSDYPGHSKCSELRTCECVLNDCILTIGAGVEKVCP